MSITGKIKTLFSDMGKTEAIFPCTKTRAVSDDNGIGLNVLLDAKQEKAKTALVSLAPGSWSSNKQTVNVSGITANNIVIVTPAPTSLSAYGEAGVYCSAQAAGKLTFTCTEVPSVTLNVNVIILN